MKDILSRVNLLLNEQENLIFDSSSVERARKQIKGQLQAPFVNVSVSNLGGTPAIMIALSLDEKNEWTNGIFENSRYTRFMLEPETNKSNLEQFSLHYELKPKFRKSKVKSIDAAINKINTWINKVK